MVSPVCSGPGAEVTPEPIPVPVPMGPLGTLEIPVPMGLLPRLDVIGYGTASVLAGTGADSEPEETPVLRGTVATSVLRMTELDVAGIAPLLVPEASDVDAGIVLADELRTDVVLWTGFEGWECL